MSKRPGARVSFTFSGYLDRAAVIKRLGRANAKALARVGAHIRRTAQTRFLRRRKRASRAGEPPSVHSRSRVANLRNIQFFYSEPAETLVVGPVKIALAEPPPIGPTAGDPVPGAVESGSTLIVREVQTRSGAWVLATKANRRKWAKGKRRVRRVATGARPFMGPSLEREREKIPIAWRSTMG